MFIAEKDLIQAFMNVAANFLRLNVGKSISPYFLVEEFDSQCGVVDIVMGTYSRLDQKELSRKSISGNWARPISNFTEDQEIEMNGFMQTFGISKTTARTRFKEYSEAGFIKKVSNGQYKVVKEYKIVTETVISIEAKLRNWKRALQQATRYKRFSNNSYVLLDEKHIGPALKSINIFKERNIGLISMGTEEYTIHYKPKAIKVPQTHSFYRLNEAAIDYFKEQLAYV